MINNSKQNYDSSAWLKKAFRAKQVHKGNVIRRAIRSVHSIASREVLVAEIKRRGFHLISVGSGEDGQYVMLCNGGNVKIVV